MITMAPRAISSAMPFSDCNVVRILFPRVLYLRLRSPTSMRSESRNTVAPAPARLRSVARDVPRLRQSGRARAAGGDVCGYRSHVRDLGQRPDVVGNQ